MSKLLSYLSRPPVRRVIISAIVTVFLAGGLYYFLREEALPPPKPVTTETQPEIDENLIFSSGSIVEQKDGKKVWELNADNIETSLRTKKMRFSQVTGTFYNESEAKNNGKISLTAQNALLDTITKDIELNGNVQIAGEGALLTAPQARWDNGVRMFSATGGISVTRDDLVLTGETIEASADMGKVVVRGRAKLVKGGGANVSQ